jgi:CRP/FNR family transcriptional regulator, cyclic AMP receptor protein
MVKGITLVHYRTEFSVSLFQQCPRIPVPGEILATRELTVATPGRKSREFAPNTFLATIGDGRKSLRVPRKQGIFTQGDLADAVFYIQRGKVRLSVVSNAGKEATIGILGDGNFFGEGALAGQAVRMGSAVAMTDCSL